MKYNRKGVGWMAQQFSQLSTPDSLARLLGIQPNLLQSLAANPQYNTFQVPKKNGSFRLIEDPDPHLKQVQKRLNTYLQCAYYRHRTPAAYGFQIAVEDDNDDRNILTNARRHMGRDWMLNADFEDFFHQIHYDWVLRLFSNDVFSFGTELATMLAQLTTYTGRLPMGAPTSPVLSNLATIPFDLALDALSRTCGWVYTRFADDLTFSSNTYITPNQIREIRALAGTFGLVFNEAKFMTRSPGTDKLVTGLVVSEANVHLPDLFMSETLSEIQKLGNLLEIHHRSGRPEARWLEQYRQQVEGQLTFAEFVLDETDQQLQLLRKAYLDAQQQTEFINEPVSWINAVYLEPASHTLY